MKTIRPRVEGGYTGLTAAAEGVRNLRHTFMGYVHRRKARAPATAMPNPCGTETEPAPPTNAEVVPLPG